MREQQRVVDEHRFAMRGEAARYAWWALAIVLSTVLFLDAALYALPEAIRFPIVEQIENIRYGWHCLRRPPEPWHPIGLIWSMALLTVEIAAGIAGWRRGDEDMKLADAGLLLILTATAIVVSISAIGGLVRVVTRYAAALPDDAGAAFIRVGTAWIVGWAIHRARRGDSDARGGDGDA